VYNYFHLRNRLKNGLNINKKEWFINKPLFFIDKIFNVFIALQI
jgi:hypothetical protein